MELLLEINTEEMPALHVKTALDQLKEGLHRKLVDAHLVDKTDEPGDIQTFGTCRRLVLYAEIVSKQQPKEEVVIGPPKKAAFDENNDPTSAAKGFAKANKVRVSDLEIIKNEKGEYVGVKKSIKGKKAVELLKNILPELIKELSFPKMMRWGESTLRFSRPIKNILCLGDGNPIPFTVGNISATHYTYGHKLFFPEKIEVSSFKEYLSKLKQQRVIIDAGERKKRIEEQVKEKLVPLDAEVYPDKELLDKVTYDVEYPYVFMGEFPKDYLKLPIEVLSTAMKVGQNLFSVVDKNNKQLPVFLGVSDGSPDKKLLVKKGNERVLKARLEDARFFWTHDLEKPLAEKRSLLSRILYQEKLGNYKEKTLRIKGLAQFLSNKTGVKENKYLLQSAELCKVDLITEMVREFPSLQGKTGGLYAKEQGYPEQVWKAVYEHYQPTSQDDPSPSTLNGAILSIADKIDSIVGAFGIGIEVTGSKDPFGLRRNAQGICRTILDKKMSFSLSCLVHQAISEYKNLLDKSSQDIIKYCEAFFKDRLSHLYEKQGYRYDLVNAALGAGFDNIYYSYLRLKALDAIKDRPEFNSLIIVVKRVNNILRGQPKRSMNSDFFIEKEEIRLYTDYSTLKEKIMPLISTGDFSKAQNYILEIRSTIDSFFDHVLVMADDPKIRKNRLALLRAVSQLFSRVADYSQVVVDMDNL
ncbi:MAG: glycine--tRNA ligase subunit beta [Candidatus Aminicenantes bacterium]|nr:glycine--tRNA ligase subunit beta [Candidatus Aminicenantes bacterium]